MDLLIDKYLLKEYRKTIFHNVFKVGLIDPGVPGLFQIDWRWKNTTGDLSRAPDLDSGSKIQFNATKNNSFQ